MDSFTVSDDIIIICYILIVYILRNNNSINVFPMLLSTTKDITLHLRRQVINNNCSFNGFNSFGSFSNVFLRIFFHVRKIYSTKKKFFFLKSASSFQVNYKLLPNYAGQINFTSNMKYLTYFINHNKKRMSPRFLFIIILH